MSAPPSSDEILTFDGKSANLNWTDELDNLYRL